MKKLRSIARMLAGTVAALAGMAAVVALNLVTALLA